MPLVNGWILPDRIQEKRVLASVFNTTSLETTIPTLNVIERSELPSLTQIVLTNAQLLGYDYIYEIVERHADKMDVPVGLHLDYEKTQEDVKQAVRAGSTSVMIDDAAFSFEENTAFTQEAVNLCKFYGVPVEAKLEAILGKKDDHVNEAGYKTGPKEVRTLIEHTSCDILTVSTDNIYGLGDIPWIDIPLLKHVVEVSPVLLVTRGGSGIVPEILHSFISYRAAKVNTASDLHRALITAIGKACVNNHNEANLARVMALAKNAIEEDAYSRTLMMNEGHRLDR